MLQITNEMSALLGKKQKILGGVDMNVELLDQLSEHSSREQSLVRDYCCYSYIAINLSLVCMHLAKATCELGTNFIWGIFDCA